MKKPEIHTDSTTFPKGTRIVDAYLSQLEELFYLDNPSVNSVMPDTREKVQEYVRVQSAIISRIWIYFPWRNTAVVSVPEDLYFRLRTARNLNVISKTEQGAYRKLIVGVAGLSVGSAVVTSLVMSGGPRRIKIADFDVIETTNLNRLRGTLLDIGSPKIEIAAKNVWELDPFTDLDLYQMGITAENITEFLASPKLNVFIDEMEAINFKILSRIIAREQKIPVLMATDNGDGILLDVERFDLEPNRALFHGLVGDITADEVKNLNSKQWLQFAMRIVGPEHLTPRMQESILSIGNTIPSIPQLGTSATLAGSAISYTVRALAAGNDVPSGRYVISIEAALAHGYNDPETIALRAKKTNEFRKIFESI